MLFWQRRKQSIWAAECARPSRHQIAGKHRFVTVTVAIFIASVAGILPLDRLATLVNTGAIVAFVAVPVSALVLRRRSPELPRPFRSPGIFWSAPIAALAGLLLLFSLPSVTLWSFLGWNAAGLIFYVGFRWRQVLDILKRG
jgi:APA family basic amino acid/polyamine antiporter